jgi:hypothetical protein
MSSHSPLMTFTGINFTLNAMPAVPPRLAESPFPLVPLLVSWPMVPLTWVPWGRGRAVRTFQMS